MATTTTAPSTGATSSSGNPAAAANGIAVVDLSPLFAGTAAGRALDVDSPAGRQLAAQIRAACESTGCFHLAGVNALLPQSSLASLYATVRAFFELPLEKKLLSRTNGNAIGRGYFAFETENVNAFMGRTGYPNDPVEKYGVGPVDPCPNPDYLTSHPTAREWWEPNIWPDEPADFRTAVSAYYRTMTNIAEILMELFSIALGMEPGFVRQHFDKGAHSLKINYYPAVSEPKECQSRLPEHTDSPPFTLLTMDETKSSLKVRTREGNWTFVDHISGSIFVNLGDTMARWTNDRWVATPHRVVWPEDTSKDRISMAFFAVPTYDTKLTCVSSCLGENEEPHYPPMTLHEYVIDKCRSMAGAVPGSAMM